jgi:tripartite-type tricarboxylate transporter receptor subunit TctC
MSTTTTRRAALALGAASVLTAPARATPAIDRTARIIIGLSPGAGLDGLARLLAEPLRGRWAPQVVVENRPGASARLAVEAVKAAPPDGSTILMTPLPVLTLLPTAFPRTTRYDPVADLAPVATVGTVRFCWLVRAAHPATTLPDFLAWAKARGGASFAPPVLGAPQHLIGLAVSRRSGVPLTAVSYRGLAPAMQDLYAGQIDAVVSITSYGIPATRDGRVRMLAVSGTQRLAAAPEVPTLAEAGFPGLPEDEGTGAVLMPAGATPALVEALHGAVRDAVGTPALREWFATTETTPMVLSPAALGARIRAERASYAELVRANGFSPEE